MQIKGLVSSKHIYQIMESVAPDTSENLMAQQLHCLTIFFMLSSWNNKEQQQNLTLWGDPVLVRTA